MRFISMCVDGIVVGVRVCVCTNELCKINIAAPKYRTKETRKKREKHEVEKIILRLHTSEITRQRDREESKRKEKRKKNKSNKKYKKKRKFQVAALNRMGMHMTSGKHAIL